MTRLSAIEMQNPPSAFDLHIRHMELAISNFVTALVDAYQLTFSLRSRPFEEAPHAL